MVQALHRGLVAEIKLFYWCGVIGPNYIVAFFDSTMHTIPVTMDRCEPQICHTIHWNLLLRYRDIDIPYYLTYKALAYKVNRPTQIIYKCLTYKASCT